MPKGLVPLTVAAPGYFGLNTQQSGSVLPPGWATILQNAVFDEEGRMACRHGSQQINATEISGFPTVEVVHEYIDNTGLKVNILAADNKIFKEVAGTITDVSGTITTPTANNWQFVNFNGWCVGFQENHAPIVTTSASTPAFADSGGTQYNGSMALAAYGRLWTVLDNTLYYSDLLINNFTGGSSGTFDLAKYWPNGMDTAVAIADFNGFLVVLGRESLIVYRDADDVSSMSIVEGISGTGCISRDSVQAIGKDLLFLSSTGLRTLGRTIKDESMPLTDISYHVRDDLLAKASSIDTSYIRSCFNRQEGFYLLSLPGVGLSYMFDLKKPNPDGSWRISTWDYAPTALMYTEGLDMLLSVGGGYLSTYSNFKDEIASDETGGSSYNINFEGVWNDFGEDYSSFLKILKSVNVMGSGTTGTDVSFKWAVDYASTFHTRALTFNATPPAQYGIAQYAIDVYSNTGDFERVRGSLQRAGQVIKVGLFAKIDGNRFAVQRIDVLAKTGRIGI